MNRRACGARRRPRCTTVTARHGEGHGLHLTLDGYLIGFGLSVILTAIPFGLVMSGVLESKNGDGVCHHDPRDSANRRPHGLFSAPRPEVRSRLELMALIFTAVILIIALTGSLWIMYHLQQNMAPMNMSTLP